LVQYLVVEEITLSAIAYSYQYDTLIWYWSADIDPNYQLFVQTRASWYGWSDNKYYNPAYDENYTLSVTTLDKVQRKVYVDNVQKVHYNDSAYIILAYADQTYAWRDDNIVGWGDWTADPGRSADNFWMGNPLWFNLTSAQGDDIIIEPEHKWYEDPLNLAIVAAVAAVVIIAIAYFVMKGRKKEGSIREPESPLGD
jgi:hypothetical protein